MISPELLQAAIVARLQTVAALVDTLPELAAGIREAQWHGTAFEYPNVRVNRPTLAAQPNGGRCRDSVATAIIVIDVHSKRDTSRIASEALGLVEAAMRDQTMETADLRATAFHTIEISPVSPDPLHETVWMGQLALRTVVTQR